MLKRGCSILNLSSFCLHNSTGAKFYPITENDKVAPSKVREDKVGGPSKKVLTHKAVVNHAHMRKSTIGCISVVGIDACQLYAYSMCQAMPKGHYTRYEFDAYLERFEPPQKS